MTTVSESVLALPETATTKASFAGLIDIDKPFQHPDQTSETHELMFVREGTLHLRVNGDMFDLEAGQALILLPGDDYGGTWPTCGRLRFYFVHFSVARAGGRSRQVSLPRTCDVARPERLTALFRLLLDDQMDKTLHCLPAQFLLSQILAELADRETLQPLHTDAADTIAERGKAFIRRNFTQPITTSTVAAALDMNPSYFGKAFCRAAGYSVTEFIARTRFYVACSMLSETDSSINQIARECGFVLCCGGAPCPDAVAW